MYGDHDPEPTPIAITAEDRAEIDKAVTRVISAHNAFIAATRDYNEAKDELINSKAHFKQVITVGLPATLV